MQFQPGTRYRFRPRPGKYTQTPAALEYHTRTLIFIRDKRGAWKSTGQRVIHHIFQWRSGALECFTDEQAGDYLITEAGRR